ncbi:MAG: acyl-ACP desaturase [Bacteroidia bacterium]|nr:acyl-ACP desaturase [Bacteroidia bacterium]
MNTVTDKTVPSDRVGRPDESAELHRILTEGRGSQSAFAGPDETPAAPRRGTVMAQIEEIFFVSYLKYFKNAEERRRWSIERDIPWDKVNPATSELTARIVESFSAVEMYLPDYTHKIMQLVRRSRGRALFQANWGYEESKHSIVLEEWLLRSGKRTEEQVRAFERALLGAEWNLPFETPRQMIIYTMIQEMATGLNYTNLRRRAEQEQDEALARVLRWVSSDESAHYNFFRKGVKAFLALDPEGTISDVRFVFEHFAMPAHALIPEWEKRGEEIEAAGIYGPKMYLAKIRRPVLEDLGISRTQLKEAGLPSEDADAIADRQEEEAIRQKQAVFHRVYFYGN